MLGGMQDWPLRIMRLLDHAEREHAKREIVSRWADGSETRTDYAGTAPHARKLAPARQRRRRRAGPPAALPPRPRAAPPLCRDPPRCEEARPGARADRHRQGRPRRDARHEPQPPPRRPARHARPGRGPPRGEHAARPRAGARAALRTAHRRPLVAWYGTIGMGGIIHTVNPRLFEEQLVYIINHAGDRVLFYDRVFRGIVDKIRPQLTSVEHFICFDPADAEEGFESLIAP